MTSAYKKLFPAKKTIIGMIHLAGESENERFDRAMQELGVYRQEGVHGAIVEDYHGETYDLQRVLKHSPRKENGLVVGLNFLSSPHASYNMARVYGAQFIQLDSIFDGMSVEHWYRQLRGFNPDLPVFGGIGFKYQPRTGLSLEEELGVAKKLMDVVVTTGEGTGMETPTDKLRVFREQLGDFPLFVGAGVNARNICEQLEVCDGAIVGSFFKDGQTRNPIIPERVRELMEIVNRFN